MIIITLISINKYYYLPKYIKIINNTVETNNNKPKSPPPLADIFIKEDTVYLGKDENPKSCSRYRYVMDTIEKEDKDIKIIEFDEFLAILGITVEKLNAMPNIDIEYLKDDKYKKET